MKVAIDGPAGSGKSTVAKAIAKRCGLTLLDTGAMYRSVALTCINRGVALDDEAVVTDVARSITISFEPAEPVQRVLIDGTDVTEAIRTPEVDRNVSAVAAIPAVREALVEQQRAIGNAGDVVAEGRDIGTVVFPDAEVKVFLTADPAARALRRAVQRDGGDAAVDAKATADEKEVATIMADLIRRDEADSSRKAAPLKPAEDAVHIDSSNKTVNEVVDLIVSLMEEAR